MSIEENNRISTDQIRSMIDKIVKYDIDQNAEKALKMVECLDLVLQLKDDEKYKDNVKSIFRISIKQNPYDALLMLKAINLIIDIEEQLDGDMLNG